MHLLGTASNVLKTALAGGVDINGDIRTPWRIVTIGRDLNAMVNNDMIASLSQGGSRTFSKGL